MKSNTITNLKGMVKYEAPKFKWWQIIKKYKWRKFEKLTKIFDNDEICKEMVKEIDHFLAYGDSNYKPIADMKPEEILGV